MSAPLDGTCAARFAPVRAALEANLAAGEEVGCAVCVTVDGETVVDLWAGHRDRARTQPWRRDTITDMKSVFALNVLGLVGQAGSA